MPNFKFTHPTTGQIVNIDSPDSSMPSEQELDQIFSETGTTQTAKSPEPSFAQKYLYPLPVVGGFMKSFAEHPRESISEIARPTLEGLGMGVGGAVGTAVEPIGGTVAGGTLGYMGGSQLSDILDQLMELQKPRTPIEEVRKQTSAAQTGAEYAMGGEIAGPLIGYGLKGLGKGYSTLTGWITGRGATNVEQMFTKGFLRNADQMDIYNTVKEGMQNVRNLRSAEYRTQLQTVKNYNKAVDVTPLRGKLDQLLKDFNLEISNIGEVIPRSGGVSKLTKPEINNIQEIVDDVGKITKGASFKLRTPEQLDIFKQKLDNFYSPNRDSRAFVTSLRNTVKDMITKNVPEYETMTANYQRASNFMDEVEKAFTGKMGRGSIDSTLKKLNIAMREEPDYRRELLEKLTGKTGKDLQQMIASESMQPWLPTGRVGHIGGLASLYEFMATHNPKFLAFVAMASPRTQAEFLNLLGQAYRGMAPALSRIPLSPYGPVLFPTKNQQTNKKGENTIRGQSRYEN